MARGALAVIQRAAELGAIGVLLIGFGYVLAEPSMTIEARGAAGVFVVTALLAISRAAIRRR